MAHTPPDTRPQGDADRLAALGYRQELRRSLGVLGNISMGFAVVSPVVGLYAVAQLGLSIFGGAWVWALPVCLLGQLLVVCVYSELASQWPLAGGAYQWTRRLSGPVFAWLSGIDLRRIVVLVPQTRITRSVTASLVAPPGSQAPDGATAPPPPAPPV